MTWQLKWNLLRLFRFSSKFEVWIIRSLFASSSRFSPDVNFRRFLTLFALVSRRSSSPTSCHNAKLTWTSCGRRLKINEVPKKKKIPQITQCDMALICKMSIWILYINWMIKMTRRICKTRMKRNAKRIKITSLRRVEFIYLLVLIRSASCERDVGSEVYICCGSWRYEIFQFL